jgi:hypothetical protein
MAPPTIPTEAKKRRGTYRADRDPGAGNTLVPVQRASITEPPPPSLKDVGAAEWQRALRVCPWIGLSDLTALRMLCEAMDRRELLVQEVETGDLMLETSTGYAYVNPALSALELGVAEVKQASALDQLAQRRSERMAGLPASTPPSPTARSRPATVKKSSSSSTPTGGSRKIRSQDQPEHPSDLEDGSDS